MKNSAIFLDRDGVINVDKNYVHKIKDLEFYEDAIAALKIFLEKGYRLFIVTNQSGIGRGYYKEEDYLNVRDDLHRRLDKQGIKITEEKFCPHSPNEECKCRKPSPAMINDLIEKYLVDRDSSYMVGDKTSDIKAGKEAGLKTILVLTGKGGKDKQYDVTPDYICESLADAGKIIK